MEQIEAFLFHLRRYTKTKGEKVVMGVMRIVKQNNFMMMDKTALEDPDLSYRAKGLLAYCMSKPDDWTFYNKHLFDASKEGRDAVTSAMKELKEKGYMIRRPARDENGKLDGWETLIFETPQQVVGEASDGKPVERDSRHTENPSHGNPVNILSNECTKNELTKNELTKNYNVVHDIVAYLNDVTGKSYKPKTQKTRSLINARLKEGNTVEDFKTVIDAKAKEWMNNEKMERYLRPATLFGTKFEDYLNNAPKRVDKPKEKAKRLSEEERERIKQEAMKDL